ncbi:MAG: class E sortase [Frankiales bacterium]|nr:class E sortase [Frankiales bacterium]
MSAANAVRTGLRGLGQTLITFGVIVLLFCFYELQITNIVAARSQDRLGDQLARSWAASRPTVPAAATGPAAAPAPSAPLPGDALARIYAPSLAGYEPRVVVEGVSVADLKEGGPGHIPGTAVPGAIGNVVLSGHRTTYGAPFNRWDELGPGAEVVVETRDSWFTYTVTGSQIVLPTAVEVTLPVPGKPGATPTERLLTMTTCNPEYSAAQRLIVSATLTATDRKSDGLPAALQAGA